MTPYQGDGEGRDCVIYAACKVMFLLLGERSADYVELLYKLLSVVFHTPKDVLKLVVF